MQFNLESTNQGNIIRSYSNSQIQINDQIFTKSLIITPTQIIEHWIEDLSELNEKNIQELIQLAPEVVLLGTGTKQKFLPPALLVLFYQQKIGVEVMTTAAACRTYDVLVSEGRKVVAALILESLNPDDDV